MPYSAGTIILQVVPSYLGFQDENEKMAKALARSLDESLEKGASEGAKKAAKRVNEILGDEVGKTADKAGQKAAEDYAGSFRTTLQGAIRKMERELKPIELQTASSKTIDDLAEVKRALDALSKTKIEPGMDTRNMERDLVRITALLDELKKHASYDVKWDVDEATKTFDAFKKKVDSYKPKIAVEAEVKFESKVADREMGAFETALKKRLKKASEALGDGVSQELRRVKAQIEGLRGADIGIDINATQFKREVDEIERELAFLAATTTDIHIHADADAALAGIESAERAREKLDGKRANVKVDVDTKGATRKLSLFDNLLQKVGIDGRDVANSFRFFSFAALAVTTVGAALIPIFAALSAGAVGLGVALVGAAAGLGILAVAFSGIQDAVSALNDAQDKSAKESEDHAKRVKSAAQQVEDAQRSLRRAREDAAQSIGDAERALERTVADSAQRQRDAARAVADAREASARAIESAIRRQEDAEERLADAQRDAAKAQQDLVEARKEAQKELEDLEDQRRRNELDQRQAVIDLFNATVENQAAQADPGATNLEREQADINLKNAQLRLKELRDQQKELDEQASKGVNNSERVKTAQEKLTDALKAQKDAQDDLAEADKELTRTRLDSAQSVQDALENQRQVIADNAQAIEDAQRNLARTQATSQQSIADAQRNLTRAQESYNETLAETSTSADKVKEAMDALGPAGRDFALFIHSLRDDFREIRDIVQAAFLPPLTEAMKLIGQVYGPGLKEFAGTMGAVFGELAKTTAQFLTNDDFKTFFATIAEIAPVITRNFGTAFLTFLQAVANIAVAFAPLAVELSEAFLGWSQAFLDWTKSEEGQQMIQDFLEYVHEIAPDVKEFFKALILALLNLAVALAPYGEKLLEGIIGFLNFIAEMDPKTLGAIVASLLAMVGGFQLLAGAISLISIVASPIGLIALAVFALAAAFVYLYNTNEAFRGFVERVWPVIQEILSKALDLWQWQITNLYNAFGAILDILEQLWHDYLEPFFQDVTRWVSDTWGKIAPLLKDIGNLFSEIGSDVWWMWNKIVWPILKTFGDIAWQLYVAIMTPAIEGIKFLFRSLGTAIKNTWDKVISPVLGWIIEKLGLDDNMKENGGGLVGAFRSAVQLIGTIWDKLKDIAKKPVDFLIGTIINGGIIGGFNQLAKHLPGLEPVTPIPWPPPGYARGGIPEKNYGVRFGYSPGRDNQLIAVGGGEAILRPEATRALGADWVNAVNKRARLFGVQGVANLMMGFKQGGIPGGNSGGGGNVGDFDVTRYKGHKFNYRTIRMLQAAERLADTVIRITQGSFSTSVAASGSTHAGGGAFDAGWPGGSVGQRLLTALRMVGFAAWHRDPSQGPWNHHIHGIAAGDPTASPAARRQVEAYYRGGDGLGGKDDGPNVKKDPSLLDKIKGGLGGLVGWVADAISNPVDWLKGKITGKLEQLTKDWGDNTLTKTLKAIPEKIINGMAEMISGGLDFIGVGSGDTSGVKGMVKQLAQSVFGWSGGQWSALERLVQKESSWNPNAQNPTSSAYGLFQFLDGTWAPYGQKTSDPRLQAQYGLQYIKDRYGDPESALAFHNSHNWYHEGGVVPDNGTMMYDNGGFLPPGVTQVVNLTGKPEPVFTADQFERLSRGSGGGAGVHYEPHFYDSDLTAGEVAQDFMFTLTRLQQGVAR